MKFLCYECGKKMYPESKRCPHCFKNKTLVVIDQGFSLCNVRRLGAPAKKIKRR